MSAALLDDLMAGFTVSTCDARATPTLAKAAKAAKPEHRRGPAPASKPCEALRIVANAVLPSTADEPDSQVFAVVRKPQSGAQSKQPCGSSQDSQNSQGCLRPYRLTHEQGERCHAGGWGDAEIAVFTARQARALRAGFGIDDAGDLAERLTLRDRDADDRASCIECRHYRPGRCGNYRRAGLNAADMGRDLAVMLKRCAGFDSTR